MRLRAYGSPVAMVVVALAMVGCGGDPPTRPDPTNQGGNNNNPPPSSTTVTVSNNAYTPSSVTIAKSGTVTWNFAAGPHTVTFSDEDSGSKSTGSFSKTFPNTGAFTYSCTIHPTMTGSVTVQ